MAFSGRSSVAYTTRCISRIKNVLKAIKEGDIEAAKAAYSKAQPIVDKAAGKGLLHKNKAARIKSRLSARIKAIAA